MDYDALQTEIEQDPEALGYGQHLPGNHNAVADLLAQNDPTGKTFYESVPAEKAARIAVETGVYASIADDAQDSTSGTRDISMGTIDTFRKSQGSFALQLQSLRDKVDTLATEGVITDTAKAAFLNASERPARREEVVLTRGASVTSQDVAKALQ